MAMVNVNNLLNIKDSRWLQLEVCREFQRNKCSRPDTECKFAHPPANVEVQNGRVTACYDSLKGRCNREKPPCKYFHPPLHLKDQLLINGRNHLALKNALMQQMGLAPGQSVVPGQVPAVATNPYLSGVTSSAYNPYFATGPLVSLVSDPTGAVMSVPQQAVVQKVHRADRLETYPGIVAYKRPADKSGVPVYQPANTPSAAAYQHLMQLQQPFVPVSSTSVQHSVQTSTSGSLNSAATVAAAAALTGSNVQDQNTTTAGLINGTLESSALGTEAGNIKVKPEGQGGGDETSELHDNGNALVGTNGTAVEIQDENKGESAIKRMRVNAVGTSTQSHYNNPNASVSAAAAIAQNNAAYVAAAQSYHSALAAMNYTGVSLQTNKNAQLAAAQAAAVQPNTNFQQAVLQQATHPSFQQHSQQQQILSQYQAMAAAFAGQGAFQAGSLGGAGNQQAGGVSGLNPGGFNPLTAAAMNPYFAASLPQLAAAQRAGLLASHQQNAAAGLAGTHFNQSMQSAANNQAAAFNPFAAMQFGGAGNAAVLQQNQQQALLAAYGQLARGSVPVTASQAMPTQQLFVGNPTVAAAAALQPGVKRMRPS